MLLFACSLLHGAVCIKTDICSSLYELLRVKADIRNPLRCLPDPVKSVGFLKLHVFSDKCNNNKNDFLCIFGEKKIKNIVEMDK